MVLERSSGDLLAILGLLVRCEGAPWVFIRVSGQSECAIVALLGALRMFLGGLGVLLGRPEYFLDAPGYVPGWARRRRNHEPSQPPYLFIV